MRTGRPVAWTREAVLRSMRDNVEKLGRLPRPSERIRGEIDGPSQTTVTSMFGTWNAALTEAGLPARPWKLHWDKQSALAAVGTFVTLHKKNPIPRDFHPKNSLPRYERCCGLFGSYLEMMRLANRRGLLRCAAIEDDEFRFVIAGGIVHLYRDKAPFTPSGKSVRGALEYDSISDLLRCHECGNWETHLASHVRYVHKMPARTYKIKHALAQKTSLINESIRRQMIASSHNSSAAWIEKACVAAAAAKKTRGYKRETAGMLAESQNSNRSCPPQLLQRIKELALQVGHTPTVRELREAGVGQKVVENRFGSIKRAMELCGLLPRKSPRSLKYSKRMVVKMFQNFFKRNGRAPSTSDLKRGGLPSATVLYRLFGSIDKARKAAGVPTVKRGRPLAFS